MYGYNGRALLVDLTTQTVQWETLPEDVLQEFIGGIGLGTYLLYKHCPPNVDPLGPANPLIFRDEPAGRKQADDFQ